MDWATSCHISCQLAHNQDSPFPLLLLTANNNQELWVHVIDLVTWKNVGKETSDVFFKQIAEYYRANNSSFVNLWEDVWLSRPGQVKERLLSLLGQNKTLAGRLTVVNNVDKLITAQFLEQWHVNGSVNSMFHYGLILPERRRHYLIDNEALRQKGDILVAVATFGRLRKMKHIHDGYLSGELVRFVSIGGVNIVGGLSKLLSAFQIDYPSNDIMTYADLDWSDGAGYLKSGFIRKEDKPPFEFCIEENTYLRSVKSSENQTCPCITGVNAGSRKWVKYY